MLVEPFGDMPQKLVFIGQDLDEEPVKEVVNVCLLDEHEGSQEQNYW